MDSPKRGQTNERANELARGKRPETDGPSSSGWNMSTDTKDFITKLKDNLDQKADEMTDAVISNAKTPRQVFLNKSTVPEVAPRPLWIAIRDRTEAIGFNRYAEFIDRVLCHGGTEGEANSFLDPSSLARVGVASPLNHPLHGVDAYQLLRVATQIFLLRECGVDIYGPRDPGSGSRPGTANNSDDIPNEATRLGSITFEEARTKLDTYLGGGNLPYLNRVLATLQDQETIDSPYCFGILRNRLKPCLLELIWSYWHEEGMLVQTINAISRRFQNKRGIQGKDPLRHLEIDPLRPVNNLLWGYIQEEHNRLSVVRRTYEYDHHYGLNLYGKAVGDITPADSRSKFIEAFHNLLHTASEFYKEDADTTVVADGFPLLNALREVHLILAQGAHNQYGDCPWTARGEMLLEQWMLARPEIADFLRGRVMVPYQEAWMGQVDTMKTLQGWTDVTITHFRNLGVYGERILLSIRHDDWIDENYGQNEAKSWARYWQQEIQSYIHAYRAVTGVDLSVKVHEKVDATLPSIHLRKRLAMGKAR